MREGGKEDLGVALLFLIFFVFFFLLIPSKHRCQTLAQGAAHSVIISGPRGNTKSPLEMLACCKETACVTLVLQIPECSAGMLARQSRQDVH